VAGRLNRESGEVEPFDLGEQILAQCWPQGTTSDIPEQGMLLAAEPLGLMTVVVTGTRRAFDAAVTPISMAMMKTESVHVEEEQLGDLKLYRVPDRTSVTSRQLKQVRLLDRQAIPVERLYGADVLADVDQGPTPLRAFLRTRNDKAHHLGLPLPSGQVSTFFTHDATPLLVNEGPLTDTALDQEVEINLGQSSDIQVTTTTGARVLDRGSIKEVPLIPGVVHLRSASVNAIRRIDITNASSSPAKVEIGLRLPEGERLIRGDVVPTLHNGRPTFHVTVPAEGTAYIGYQTERTSMQPVPR
jgi:hypothetical protein